MNKLQVTSKKWFKTFQQESVMLNLFQHFTSLASALLNCKILNQVQDDVLKIFPLLGGKYRFGISIPTTPPVKKRVQSVSNSKTVIFKSKAFGDPAYREFLRDYKQLDSQPSTENDGNIFVSEANIFHFPFSIFHSSISQKVGAL